MSIRNFTTMHLFPDRYISSTSVPQMFHVDRAFPNSPITTELMRTSWQLVPPVGLRPAGKTRAHVIGPVEVPLSNQVILIPQCGPGSNHRHFPGKNLENLRQFVQGGLAQNAAYPGNILLGVFQKVGGGIVGVHIRIVRNLRI